MKKIKLLTPILGPVTLVTAMIPIASCSSKETTKWVPTEKLNIVANTFKGFKEGTDLSLYNAISIPETVKIIDDNSLNNIGNTITKISFNKNNRYFGKNLFNNNSSVNELDFSTFGVDEIYYLQMDSSTFSGLKSKGTVKFNSNLSDKSKETIISKLLSAGLSPTWFVEETTGNISCAKKEITCENGNGEFEFALTKELQTGSYILCSFKTTSISENVNLTVTPYVTVEGTVATIAGTLSAISGALNTGDNATFDVTFSCYSSTESQLPTWVETISGLKLTIIDGAFDGRVTEAQFNAAFDYLLNISEDRQYTAATTIYEDGEDVSTQTLEVDGLKEHYVYKENETTNGGDSEIFCECNTSNKFAKLYSAENSEFSRYIDIPVTNDNLGESDFITFARDVRTDGYSVLTFSDGVYTNTTTLPGKDSVEYTVKIKFKNETQLESFVISFEEYETNMEHKTLFNYSRPTITFPTEYEDGLVSFDLNSPEQTGITISYPDQSVFKQGICNLTATLEDTATPGEYQIIVSHNLDSNLLKSSGDIIYIGTKTLSKGKNIIPIDYSNINKQPYSYYKSAIWQKTTVRIRPSSDSNKPYYVCITNGNSAKLKVGETLSLSYSILPENSGVTWKSNDEEVATVDSTGKVTAKKKGCTRIRVTSDDANYISDSIEIAVL